MYLNPNAKLAYKKLFPKFCDTLDVFCYGLHLDIKYTHIGDSHRAFLTLESNIT